MVTEKKAPAGTIVPPWVRGRRNGDGLAVIRRSNVAKGKRIFDLVPNRRARTRGMKKNLAETRTWPGGIRKTGGGA